MTFQQGNRLSDLKYNDNRYLKKSGTTQIISGDIIITGGVTGISLPHGGLTDMPDTSGIVSDHDARLATKVDPSEPTIPVGFYTGMLWFDTDDDSSVGGGTGVTGLQGATGIGGGGSGDINIDGGSPSSVYLPAQSVDGGAP